ncbi:HD-GYP domain-containing protein [Rhodoferax sp. BAB1]|uniref:HD-GYP domain-containing protein n=1 Tax=Rhodoferax sp. BAB1 TaxID=2741720 RepID=UPI00157564AA|nr:HD domain-containing phosphohydrolase [Rhodoferax sp. BAB1]QKO22065.1 HD domain-containing protein [Rhodoferax sp. BAB1]
MHTDTQYFTKAVTELGRVRPVVTTQPIYNAKGIKIIEQGVAINPGLYDRLMEHRLSAPIEDSVSSLPTVNGHVLRKGMEEMAAQTPFFARMLEDSDTRNVLFDIVERIHLPDPIAFQLTMACEIRPSLYQHLLSTTLTACWLAAASGMSRLQLRVAATAGLLHDIGMLHLDPRLLEYKVGIDRSQHRQLVSHPMVSSALIERHKEYPREVVQAVLEHHEFLDGSGYPRNLREDGISPCGKLMALTELVTGAFAPGREVPELRLSILLRMNTHRYDAGLSEKIIALLRPQNESVESITLLEDPIRCLLEIQAVLTAWPEDRIASSQLVEEHKKILIPIAAQAAQLSRTLARAGAAPEQLEQLGKDALDQHLQAELTLLASEAAWQLRALARQVRRHWRTEADDATEQKLHDWLASVDAAVSRTTREYSSDDA